VDSGLQATSVVGEVETRRACRRASPQQQAHRVEAVLTPVSTLAVDDVIAETAAALVPAVVYLDRFDFGDKAPRERPDIVPFTPSRWSRTGT
jgi:hypothetical protein